jgi:hypothetical protein
LWWFFACLRRLKFFDVGCSGCVRLSVGGLEDLALGRVVPEQLLDQVDVGKQHAAAAVASESKIIERLSVGAFVSACPNT